MYLKPGVMVVFEGLDKTGKSTQVSHLLEAMDRPTAMYHMPSGSQEFSRKIYEITEEVEEMPALARQFLHLACHSAHQSEIRMRLLSEAVVLDRFWWSTMAYGWHSNPEIGTLFSQKEWETLLRNTWDRLYPNVVFLFLHTWAKDRRNRDLVRFGYQDLYRRTAYKSPELPVLVPPMDEYKTHEYIVGVLRDKKLLGE
jgi:dTMP kinase